MMVDIIQRATDMRRMLQEYFTAHEDADKTTAINSWKLFLCFSSHFALGYISSK